MLRFSLRQMGNVAKFLSLIILFILFFSISTASAENTINIASWNIRDFGKTKAQNNAKIAVIGVILSQYDVIAIQEISNIREQSDPGCPRNEDSCPGNKQCGLIEDSLNRALKAYEDRDYRFLFSPQVKDERYLFIYDANKVNALDAGTLVIDYSDDPEMPICDLDAEGNMVRQPFYATFKAGDFDFTLVTAHTKPDKNISELQALELFYRDIENLDSGQNDVILLGDLNADCSYLPTASPITLKHPEYFWVVEDGQDTTVTDTTDCAYDRIIFTTATEEDYSGNHGVFKFDEVYDLSKETGLSVSDHYPVWAEFDTDKDTDH
jgi:endonuclease/exonuclease/phosphatase family metal-dependent hydrolase